MTRRTGILLQPPPHRESVPWPSHKGRKGLVQGTLSTGEPGDETQFSFSRLQPGIPTGRREGEGEWPPAGQQWLVTVRGLEASGQSSVCPLDQGLGLAS